MKSSTRLSWTMFFFLQFMLVGLLILLFWKLTFEIKTCSTGVENMMETLGDIKYQLDGAEIVYEN